LEIMVSIVIGLYQQRGLAHLCSMQAQAASVLGQATPTPADSHSVTSARPEVGKSAAQASVNATACVRSQVEFTSDASVSSHMPITECVGNKSDDCVIDPCLLDV